MPLQDQYDEAMFAFSRGEYERARAILQAVLGEDPNHFDARLALGMTLYRLGDYADAITEGHKAERLKPQEQLVHTNLSLFYLKAGNRAAAEHHGLQARISSWRAEARGAAPPQAEPSDPELQIAKPNPQPVKIPARFPDMPWKKKPQTAPEPPSD